jgi:predicted DNA-binding protein
MHKISENNMKIQVILSNETYKRLLKRSLEYALENETSSSISRYVRELIERDLNEKD